MSPLSPHCQNCHALNKSIFCDLQTACLDYLRQKKSDRDYVTDHILFHEGHFPEGIYCLNSGLIKLYKNGKHGKQTIIRLAMPGDLLGHRSLFADSPYNATAQILKPANICFLPRDAILHVLNIDPRLNLKLLQYLSASLGAAENRIRDFAQKTVTERVATFLLGLWKGTKSNQYDLDIPLTREEIAELIGSTPESVTRSLTDFSQQGIIKLNRRQVSILDSNSLMAYDA